MLNPRHDAILKAVVLAHLKDGSPVGSTVVARDYGLDLSSATVRNVMAELEEMGYLQQPHTSAGRVPTDKGLRRYVDDLLEPDRLSAEFRERIQAACDRGGEDPERILEETSRVLSTLTNCASIVLPPSLSGMAVRRLRFLRMGEGRVLALLELAGGALQSRLFPLEERCTQRELDAMGEELTGLLEGMTLRQVQRRLKGELAAGEREYRALRKRLLTALFTTAWGVGGVIINGRINLMNFPELADVTRLREALGALEDKRRLIRLLDRCLEAEGVQILIGSEAPLAAGAGLTVVAARFTGGEGALPGSLGLMGPTRLDYAQAIPLVEFTASILSATLARRGLDREQGMR